MRAVTSKSNLRFPSVRINPELLSRRAGHGLLQRVCARVCVLQTASQGRRLSGTLQDAVVLRRFGAATVLTPVVGTAALYDSPRSALSPDPKESLF